MANRWCDGFGRYGGDKTKMLNGSSSQAWAAVSGNFTLSTSVPRTGTHALRFSSSGEARRVFGDALESVYLGFAVHCDSLPNTEPNGSTSPGVILASFRNVANERQFGVVLGTDGALVIYRRCEYNNLGVFLGTLIHRSSPVIGAGAYQHIEIYAHAGETDGAIEIRVDEVTRVNLTGINNIETGDTEFSQFAIENDGVGSASGVYNFADFYVNDTVNDGSGCHTFIGDCKSGVLMVDADTAQADFDLSAGATGYALLEGTPPDDATYISTPDTTARSDFGIADAPENLSEILTVRPFVRAQKDDAGSALIAPSMVSNGTKASVDGQPITTAFAYYDANVPLNPDTSAPWTRTELNAALEAVERTA